MRPETFSRQARPFGCHAIKCRGTVRLEATAVAPNYRNICLSLGQPQEQPCHVTRPKLASAQFGTIPVA